MKFDQIKELSEEQFGGLTGVKKTTLKRMLDILREADAMARSMIFDFLKKVMYVGQKSALE